MKVLVTATSLNPVHPNPALEQLNRFADRVVFNPHGRPLTEDELIPLLEGCEGYIAGLDFITKKVIEQSPSLRVISRYGAGVDRLDLEAARAKGILVCNTPGVNAQAVADLTIALILSVARRIPFLDRNTRQGRWPRSTGVELYGKTMGILGLGAIGKAVAKRAAGFAMHIMAYDPYMDEAYAKAQGIVAADFDTLVTRVDFLCLHLPLTAETRHIISGEVMKRMKPGVIMVNTARGGLIDEQAAYELLQSGHLGGLGIDVYEEEPPKESPLFTLDNVVLTPHTASHTREATAAMASLSVQNLIDVLSGRDCPYLVR
ncbi:phosphoglycerate dehydrogenase [Treponema sp. TIM-1]|uniref:phosphoglycerate dehydrogenase n=1 Tax=Treponema sp. TIM-1 TaxID=2898417 RepID=UPI00397F97D5